MADSRGEASLPDRRVTLPTPAIVTQGAVRALPRPALALLCLAYVLPGFVAREPWRMADMEAFGHMRALALGHAAWLKPSLGGLAAPDGLLPYWLGALAMQWAPPWMDAAMAARLPFMGLLLLTLAATRQAVYCLAHTPDAAPLTFAFGGEASTRDYARALADAALLALLACLGLAQLAHEASGHLVQLAGVALLFFATAAMPMRPRAAACAAFVGLGGLALSGAPALACVLAAGGAALAALVRMPGTTRRNMWLALPWLAAAALAALLATVLDLWGGQAADGVLLRPYSLLRLLLWFGWPAWPLALWTLWVWRRQLGLLRPHVGIPLFFVLAALLSLPFAPAADRALLVGLPALAALAAFSLPTLGRSIAALIDWFTLLFFSASALAIWVIWLSLQTGIPAKPAANVARLAPQFVMPFSALALLCALLATLAWCALVFWRSRRHRAPLWKSLVLPAAGATLCWLLMMTLWLPLLDHARSFAPHMHQVLAHIPAGAPCLYAHPALPPAHLAALRHYGSVPVRRWQPGSVPHCGWMVAEEARWQQHPAPEEWRTAARVVRPSERNDFLLVLQRLPQGGP